MRKKLYYLVARNLESNELEFVKIGNSYGKSLEEIDLFTTDFNYKRQLLGYLAYKGIIKSSNVDLFIVKQNKYNEEVLLDFYEVLYAYNDSIKPIAKKSLDNKIDLMGKEIKEVFYNFYNKMMNDYHFRSFVLAGNTNIYSNFLEYFRGEELPFDTVMYKNNWGKKSYPLIRNIMDVYNKYHLGVIKERVNVERYKLNKELIYYTDGTYDFNQCSIFDDGDITRDSLEYIK